MSSDHSRESAVTYVLPWAKVPCRHFLVLRIQEKVHLEIVPMFIRHCHMMSVRVDCPDVHLALSHDVCSRC